MLAARAAAPARRSRGRVALAVVAELVHSATLLHDDVIDDGLTRRGMPAPRVAYGNGVSVLAGDWLLAASLDLTLRSRVAGAMEALVRTLRTLVDYFIAHPEAGMVGPRLRGIDGNVQVSCRPRPTLTSVIAPRASSPGKTSGTTATDATSSAKSMP